MRLHRAPLLVLLVLVMVVSLVPTRDAAAADSWLTDVNLLRELGGLDPVREDAAWSDGSQLHSRYMARNGVMTHEQVPGRPDYTSLGAAAGRTANLAFGYRTTRDVLRAWLGSAGHAYWLLNPAATKFGYGQAVDGSGVDWWTMRVFPTRDVDQGVPSSGGLLWPAQGAVVPTFSSALRKYPDCAGSPATGGLAIYWRGRTAPAAATMTVDGREVATCVFSYSPQWHGVAALRATPSGATVVVDLHGVGMPGPRTFRTASGFAGAGPTSWPSPDPRSIDPACAGVGAAAGFTDVRGTLFAEPITCVGWRDITEGFPDGTYRPTNGLTRGQTFAFVARLLDEAGLTRPVTSPDAYRDDDGTLFERDIDWLADLGLLPDGSTVDPGGAMRRGLMAELMRGAVAVVGEPTPGSRTNWFGDDDGTPYERAIGWVADEGIVLGVEPGTFAPDDRLTRGQMATFLARTLALLES